MSNTNKLPTVHYLSLRSYPKFEKEKRRNPPSAQKVDYIIDSLNSLGYHVNYVSFSESLNDKLCRAKKMKLSEMTDFYLCPNIPGKYRESFTYRWFKHIYAPKHIKYGDILLVYHTNGMRNDVLRSIADKYHMKFVYEVEEIYAYAHDQVSYKQVNEEIEFLQCPDRYFFCSELIAEKVNKSQKPYLVVEGYYKHAKANIEPFADGKIHCVYGGIIDEVKGGAFRAVRAAQFLPEDYVIHILGFGDTGKLNEIIDSTAGSRKCQVVYEGLKNGQDYIDFISRCHIGLSLMTMREDINNSAFPSKLVLYLSCGLRTVACRVKVLEISKMADSLVFYDEDTPESIAEAIMSIDIKRPYDSKQLMDSLDQGFKNDLKCLLER